MFESIVHILGNIADKNSGRAAIVDSGGEHSYGDLREEIQACSEFLKATGIRPGNRVALLLNNSFQYVVAYYGVLSSGGVVVALNTNASLNDVNNWMGHCGASMLITETSLFHDKEITNSTADRIHLEILDSTRQTTDSHIWRSRSTSGSHNNAIGIVEAGQIASIIYTSGTTGNPKGVTLTHGNLFANFSEIIQYLRLSSSDSIINILPFYYSYGNSILHTHLLSGATIYIENSFMYPAKILQKMSEYKTTGFSGVPATYSILLNRTNMQDYDLSSLRYITQAGGAMPPANIQRIQKLLPDTKIFIMYGQTEATARISYLEPDLVNGKLGSIGKPLKGLTIQIRDDNNQIVGTGTEGQLYVSGPSVMKGYWGDDQLTASVINDGFLRTGDIGYFDNDGFIYLTGRLSDMIKVGGNRISPLEIEEVVTQLDGIEEVAASGVDDEMLGQVVKLSIVKKPGANISEMQIKAYCRQHLALYKIPKFIEFAESLPKTASGKVKRYLL